MYSNLLLFCFTSFIITYYFIPVTIKISNKYDIYDYPDDRKKHVRKVSFLGGIALMISYSISLAIFWSQKFIWPGNYHYIFMSLMMIAFIGLGDDLLNFKPLKKLTLQLLAGALLVYKGDFYLPFDQILPFIKIPVYLNYCITLIVIGGIANAYNLIDGSDGLAASLGIIITLFYNYIFFTSGQYFYSALSVSVTGSLIAFFLYNKPPAHTFMGDCGSLFLGMLFAIFTLYFIQKGGQFSSYPINTRIILAFSLLAVPLLDTIRLFFLRIYNKKGPFTGDNNHIHHLLKQLGYTPVQVVLWILFLQLLIIGIALMTGNKFWLGFVIISICIYGISIQGLRQLITFKGKLDQLNQLSQNKEETTDDDDLIWSK